MYSIFKHRVPVGLRSIRGNYDLSKVEKEVRGNEKTHTHYRKTTLTIYFSVSDSSFLRISKRCRLRLRIYMDMYLFFFFFSYNIFTIALAQYDSYRNVITRRDDTSNYIRQIKLYTILTVSHSWHR
jgi:hypothetical protein